MTQGRSPEMERCIDACERCDDFPDDERMRDCADACRLCADACRQMVLRSLCSK